jgi:hypothetical protein
MCAAGGCCTSDVVNGGAGFGVLHFLPAGGMRLELIHLGHNCNLWPAGATEEELRVAEGYYCAWTT